MANVLKTVAITPLALILIDYNVIELLSIFDHFGTF